jgi:threonylcarbamoyladenosine tRNA methylthiotransferase MtaB
MLRSSLVHNNSVDLIVGQTEKFSIPEMLNRLHPDRFPAPNDQCPTLLIPQFETKRALIKVQDGCDFHCAYCIVPTARGNPVSRPLAQIHAEVERVVENGFNEIILTGANLGRYNDGDAQLVELIKSLEWLPSLKRIRLSSIELTTAEKNIIDHMADSPKLCHFLHIPLQSGDDGILASMGRRYQAGLYRNTIDYALKRVPDLGLGTDLIVGFPGEDDGAFNNTVDLVRSLPFSNLHVFPYSRRIGTRADEMTNQIPDITKKERLKALTMLGESKRQLFAESFIGKTVEVLIERVDEHGIGHGWTGQYLQARLTSDGAGFHPRQIVSANVTQANHGTIDAMVRSCGDK